MPTCNVKRDGIPLPRGEGLGVGRGGRTNIADIAQPDENETSCRVEFFD